MKLLVTGASGFVGSLFVKYALNQGFKVRVVSRDRRSVSNGLQVDVHEADLTKVSDWSGLLDGIDCVVHAAGEVSSPRLMHRVNFEASVDLFQAANRHGVRRWIQLSSVGAYGTNRRGIVTEDVPDAPEGVYEVSKSEFDQYLLNIPSGLSMDAFILRPSIIYGPEMRSDILRKLIFHIRQGTFTYIGPPGFYANFVHIDDVVRALSLCVTTPLSGKRTYIVSDHSTLEELVASLATGVGVMLPRRRVPLRLARSLASAMKWLPAWPLTEERIRALTSINIYGTEKIETELHWKVEVPISVGMREFGRSQAL